MCLALSVFFTTRVSRVSLEVMLGLTATVVAALWSFAPRAIDRESDGWGGGLTIVETAGITAALTVVASVILGHPLVATTTHLLQDAVVSGGTTRGSGAFTSPNEAALIASAGAVAAMMCLQVEGSSRRRFWHVSVLGAGFVGVVLSGSRASLVALLIAGAVLAIGVARARPRLTVWLGLGAIVAALWAVQVGTFAGRSINLFSASDASATYRHAVQSYLFAHVQWTELHGYGFSIGNEIASNPLTGVQTAVNVDEAWLYALITLGALSLIGFAGLAMMTALRTALVWPAAAIAAAGWFVMSSVSENLFLVPGAMAMAMLLLASGRTRGRCASFRHLELDRPPEWLSAGAVADDCNNEPRVTLRPGNDVMGSCPPA